MIDQWERNTVYSNTLFWLLLEHVFLNQKYVDSLREIKWLHLSLIPEKQT